MQFYGQSEQVASRILDLFRAGNLPAALAPVFVHRTDAVPCRAWSWANQLITALAGTSDARGFRQWLDVGRAVGKGTHAFQILGPITKKVMARDDETGEEREVFALVGFKSIPVFRLEDTDVVDAEKWTTANKASADEQRFIDGLPLVSVARAWGVNVETYNGRDGGALGWYRHGQAIALGTRNLSTWAHELVHAADDRRGALTKGGGQKLDNETVAELGGAILLTLLGDEQAADYGGCWSYIDVHATKYKFPAIRVCEQLLSRTCEAVRLILDTAAELASAAAPAAPSVAA